MRYQWSGNDFLYGQSGTIVAWIDPLESTGSWEIIFQLSRGICFDRADSEAEARRIVERQFGVENQAPDLSAEVDRILSCRDERWSEGEEI